MNYQGSAAPSGELVNTVIRGVQFVESFPGSGQWGCPFFWSEMTVSRVDLARCFGVPMDWCAGDAIEFRGKEGGRITYDVVAALPGGRLHIKKISQREALRRDVRASWWRFKRLVLTLLGGD